MFVDNYLTASTRDYNNKEIFPALLSQASQSDICLSFDIKFNKVGSSRYREPQVVITDGSDLEGSKRITVPRENGWFHAQVNRSGADVVFILYVVGPNVTIGLDNVSTHCSPVEGEYSVDHLLPFDH